MYKIREKKLPMALQRAVVRDNSATARRLSSACRVPIGLELPSTGSLCFFEEKLGVLKKHCKRYGRDYSDIKKSAGLHLALKGAEAPEPAPYEKYSGKRNWEYKTPEEAAKFIRGYKDLGATHFVIVFPYGAEAKSIEVLMEKVAPLV